MKANTLTFLSKSEHSQNNTQRFKQIYAKYKTTHTAPQIGPALGRPKKQITKETEEIIKQAYEKDQLSAQYLEKRRCPEVF